jgi:hypothetical protein
MFHVQKRDQHQLVQTEQLLIADKEDSPALLRINLWKERADPIKRRRHQSKSPLLL